ncbi:MAG: alpha/beta hydrolase [Paenibacillaceae bacterium]|jgi:acetyl esterase/lipase|nr:alpha/beta hydrolase [Paenibacillaceae bacterium]
MNISPKWEILPEDQVQETVYRTIHHNELKLLVMQPHSRQGESPAKLRPVLAFIHGGGFEGGTAEVLLPQCRYFVQLGYVCVSVEYRLMKRTEGDSSAAAKVTLEDCLADCKEAVRYVRRHAPRWQADPDQLVLFGESAGGYLASAVAALNAVEAPGEQTEVSCVPNFLVVYNPITHLLGKWKMRVEEVSLSGDEAENEAELWQVRHQLARRLSPLVNLTAEHPPTLVIHGLLDTVVPPEDSAEYAQRLGELGVPVRLELFPQSKHAFALFNYTATESELARTLEITKEYLDTMLL